MVDMNAMICLGRGKQIADERGESRGFSWIKPQMMQQVFSSIALSHEKRAAQFPSKMELLNLFPQSTDSRSVSGSSSEKESNAELVIFYNGEVKAFHVSGEEAEAVMKLASTHSSGERATLKPSQGENEESKNVRKGVPMARKLSLQRFLQKRKERVGSLNPYMSADNKIRSKVCAEENEDGDLQIGLSLSFPSQRCG